jgi:Carboxypeptidase regulatory-like domain
MKRRLSPLFAFFLLTAAACSNSSKGSEIKGKVTFKGTALSRATVSLYDDSGSVAYSSSTLEDGSFAIGGVKDGTYKVTVSAFGSEAAKGSPKMNNPMMMKMKGKSDGPGSDVREKSGYQTPGDTAKIALPKKYSNAASSGFVWDTTKDKFLEIALTE